MQEANENISTYFIFHFGHFSAFSVFSVFSSTPVGVIYSIPQKIPIKLYIIGSLSVMKLILEPYFYVKVSLAFVIKLYS